ncbi:hypothetical protein AMTRI_Chr09g14210 [Amborella trichopoda]
MNIEMEGQTCEAGFLPKLNVKATLCLGVEKFNVCVSDGLLSDQLAAMKEECMRILKDHITKNNAPMDVPDEPLEGSSEDEPGDPPKKLTETGRSKKRK